MAVCLTQFWSRAILHTKFSQGSEMVKKDGMFKNQFITTPSQSLSVKEFWKLINILQSQGQKYSGAWFPDTVHNQYWTWVIANKNSVQCAFSALTMSVRQQEGHPACKNWVVRYWHGYLSGSRCMVQLIPLAPHHHKLQNGLPFWCRLTQVVLEKGC